MSANSLSWGSEPTQFFYKITPDVVLGAVEASGFRCTGRCSALNSMENRVYEIELDLDEGEVPRGQPWLRFRVAKFYRPGRWTREQILEEHQFLLDLAEQEIPVVAPLRFKDGQTLQQHPDSGIYYAIFPKQGGRAPEELDDPSLQRMGRLLARIHNVGAARESQHRIFLNPQTYGRSSLEFLLRENKIPEEVRARVEQAVLGICEDSEPWFKETPIQRIHGDCHFGNILWSSEGPMFLDFDDMVRGPCAQDLWLVVPGRDEEAKRQFEVMLTAYREMRAFDQKSLRLIEPLRALRFIHFAAWIAKRWEDPAFPRTFPNFGSAKYWEELASDLYTQWSLTREIRANFGD